MEVYNQCSGQGCSRSISKSQLLSTGTSLIEILAVLVIISILVVTTFPGLIAFLAKERSTALTNNLAGALAYARSEAILKQKIVLTCQSIDASTCNKSQNWQNGWIIFVDENRNKQREPSEVLLRVYAAADNGTQAIFKGSWGIRHYVYYKPTGTAHPNGSFLICNPAIGVGKALIMSHSGRLRLSKKQTSGSAVTCR